MKWDVDLYQNQHSFVWEYGASLIDLLDPQPGERILDVGCGSGELTNEISKRGAIGIGLDADSSMVERAKKLFTGTTFLQADLRNFELEDGPVDAIFSNAALHWVKDADSAVDAMARALKPGGRFVVEFGGKGHVGRIVDASLQVLGRPNEDSPWYFPGIAEYATLLENNGIEVVSAALFERPTLLEEGEKGMSNWLRMFGEGLFKGIPEDMVDKAVDEIVAKLQPELYDGERWIADYRRLRIVGRKLES
jgi:SAM-dependent methyltransferase